MDHRKTSLFGIVLLGLTALVPPPVLEAAAFEASLLMDTIAVGGRALVTGTADPGSQIGVTAVGPAAVPQAGGSPDATGKFMISIGPFPAKGTYNLTVRSGNDQRPFVLEVEDQVAGEAVVQAAELFNQANNEALAALENALDVVEQQINRFPPNSRGIPEARQGIARMRAQHRDMAVVITTIIRVNTEFAAGAGRPPFRPYWNDLDHFYREQHEGLHAAATNVNQAADPAEFDNLSDWCARALKAKAVFLVVNTMVELWRSKGMEFVYEKMAGLLALGAAKYGLQGTGRIWPTERGTPLEEELAVNFCQSFAEGAFALATKTARQARWDLILEAADFIITSGLDIYLSYYCLTFSGRMAGHVRVQALEKTGAPYWTQDNDWEGDVTLTARKPEHEGEERPLWGIIYGKGKKFVGTNQLAALFPRGTLTSLVFLTAQPSKIRQALAYFAFRLEGTVSNDTITLKLGSAYADMFKGLVSDFASIVMQTYASVPVVNTYKIPFQNAAWQLSRTLSSEGTTYRIFNQEAPSGATERHVREEKRRELTAQGARGLFTWKIHICAGCPSEWKPDF